MYDFHIHTNNSPDAGQTIDEVCGSAISKGLEGIAITDHVDMWFYDRDDTEKRISKSISDMTAAREKYGDKLDIMKGVEMAEYLFDPKKAEIIMKLTDYDVILGSVHSVLYDDWTDSYSRLDFSEAAAPIEKIKGFIREYFKKVYEMAEMTDFDVLTHLTCPLRYINGKYGRAVDSADFKAEIEDILKLIIKKGVSLEVNTSGVGTALDSTMPDSDIIKLYYDLGGRKVTVGSDAHTPDMIANGFETAVSELRKIGFDKYYTFRQRKPISHEFILRI